VLRRLYPENAYVEINPADAARAGIKANSWVDIVSRRGRVKVRAFVTGTVASGQIFMPMHYAVTNQLTYPAFDPYSRQPSYKACAVAVRPLRNGTKLL
jgi:assimilatory nitrate reductase catalytic subunit